MEKCEINNEPNKATFSISRPIYTQKQFDEKFEIKNPNNTKKSTVKALLKALDPRRILNLFTILRLITEYNFKNDLIVDLFSGLTVGIMHIPVVSQYLKELFLYFLIELIIVSCLWCTYFAQSSQWFIHFFLHWTHLCFIRVKII